MPQVRIEAEPRSDFGKGAARRLRRDGRVPGVIYGRGAELQHVSVDAHALSVALTKPKVTLDVVIGGDTVSVAPRQVQRDAVRRIVEHVDLVIISAAEARERAAEAEVIAAAEAAAAEVGLDPIAVAEHAAAAVEAGATPAVAIAQALEEVKELVAAQAASNAADAAAEAAADAEAAGDPALVASGDAGAAGEESAESDES